MLPHITVPPGKKLLNHLITLFFKWQFLNSNNVTVNKSTFDVKGYAVRFGESSGGVGAAETYAISDCTLKSANDDGDATIILRGTADYATLTITNTTIIGTPDIKNTATGATVVK